MSKNTETGYIHINQAVRRYGKTRQTFYNYINKWFVKSKKVNNKVFLNITDIENILNDYIEDLDQKEIMNWNDDWAINGEVISEISEPSDSETTREITSKNKAQDFAQSDVSLQENVLSETITYKIQALFEWFSSLFERQITEIENNIVTSNKRNVVAQITNVQTYLENKHRSHSREIADMKRILNKQQQKNRKLSFWIYYLVFVSINIFIIRVISA